MNDIYAQQISADKTVGINQFKKFNLDAGHTANMHFNQKDQSVSVDNLVNLVEAVQGRIRTTTLDVVDE